MAKNEQVCIDQCKFQLETNQLEIKGWALDLVTKDVPTITVHSENVTSDKIESVSYTHLTLPTIYSV